MVTNADPFDRPIWLNFLEVVKRVIGTPNCYALIMPQSRDKTATPRASDLTLHHTSLELKYLNEIGLWIRQLDFSQE